MRRSWVLCNNIGYHVKPGTSMFWATPIFVALAYQGEDIVVRFIIENSSSKGFWPLGSKFVLYKDFWKMIFGLCWNLRLVTELWYLEGFWFLLEGFFEDCILTWWNIWISIIFLCLKIFLNVNSKATVWHTPWFHQWHSPNIQHLFSQSNT
jgi:hypothetical protein